MIKQPTKHNPVPNRAGLYNACSEVQHRDASCLYFDERSEYEQLRSYADQTQLNTAKFESVDDHERLQK